jgi:predicted RNA binding protein with dsRBD fold (UPF0201 family)
LSSLELDTIRCIRNITNNTTTHERFGHVHRHLQRLPEPLDRDYIQKARQRVLKELTVVSKKVFQLILEKQSSYTGEIQR